MGESAVVPKEPTPRSEPLPGILVVDDDPDQLLLLKMGLEGAGYRVTPCHSGGAALDALAVGEFDCVVTDVLMEGMTGIELCERIAGAFPDLPVIVVTTSNRLETAIAAIRVAAYDFITKPVHFDALVIALERAVERRRLRREVKVLRELVAERSGYDELLGGSVAMRKVYGMLEQVANPENTNGAGEMQIGRASCRERV